MTRYLLGWILILSSVQAFAEEEKKPATKQEIETLVARLISPNPKPITGDDDKSVAPDYRLPPGFDKAKQLPVLQARVDLAELGLQAFPYLIDKWDDKQHCITMFHSLSEYSHNVTVGFVCQKILFDQLQPYSIWPRSEDDPRGKPKRPSYPSAHLRNQREAREWWEKHKTKTMFEIQLEVLDWVIAEEAKRPADYSDEEREFVKMIREELLRRRVPMPPGNYDWMNPEL